jgi:hypothetical protein
LLFFIIIKRKKEKGRLYSTKYNKYSHCSNISVDKKIYYHLNYQSNEDSCLIVVDSNFCFLTVRFNSAEGQSRTAGHSSHFGPLGKQTIWP